MAKTEVTYQPIDYVDLTERTYRALKDKILQGELRPGDQISVPNAAMALGVSRTPVNDALKRLANDGLVEIVPRQGTFVTQLRSRDVADIFDMRLMIELWAAETIVRNGAEREALELVQSAVDAMEEAIAGKEYSDHQTYILHDQQMHTGLVALANNKRLLRSYTQLHANILGARVHYLAHDDARETQREHRAILKAWKRGDLANIKDALRSHITRVQRTIVDVLEQRGGKL